MLPECWVWDVGEARKFLKVLGEISQITRAINDAVQTRDDQVLIVFENLDLTNVDTHENGWNSLAQGCRGDTVNPLCKAVESGGRKTEPTEGRLSNVLAKLEDVGISLPILDSSSIYKFLMGQVVDVITWELPRFELEFGWGPRFPILPFPPITAGVGLQMDIAANFGVGFDTSGISKGKFLDGFYFDDVRNGSDVSELEFGAGINIDASLDLGVARAGVQGEVRGSATANWRDLDSDGKLYLDELETIISRDGIGCIFELTGSFDAFVNVIWQVRLFLLKLSGKIDLVDFEIFSIDNNGLCPKYEPAHVVGEDGELLPDLDSDGKEDPLRLQAP